MELSHTHHWQGGLTMSFSNQGRFRQQVRFLRRQFLQDGDLQPTDVLSEGTVTHALKALTVVWLDRVYSPLITLWMFLGQVLSQDHSCRASDRSSRRRWATSLLSRNQCLLPSEETTAGRVLRSSCPEDGPRVG
jgi:hypothetical protein